MKTFVVSLFNSHTGHYSPPLVFDTKEQAVNSFIGEIQNPQSEIANIKDRLTIFLIGRFDHQSGKIHSYIFKKLLIKGTEVLTNVQQAEILFPSGSPEREQLNNLNSQKGE